MNATVKQPRKRRLRTLITKSDIPLVVYTTVLVSMTIIWIFRALHPDLALNLISELLGAAFTLFIIDALLVRSRVKRWKVVREHINYLISRNVNRIRDGIAVRAFHFDPELQTDLSTEEQITKVREQRAEFLSALERLHSDQFRLQLSEKDLFTEASYDYFNEKADDIWDILNMKYSENLEPDLVSDLIRLHTNLKDVCGHLRQYKKGERFPDDREYYQTIGLKGAGVSLKKIIQVVNHLKNEGYSEAASLTGEELSYADTRLF